MSSSSAATASSSLRPLASRTVSSSNGRPITAAAASTWRPVSVTAANASAHELDDPARKRPVAPFPLGDRREVLDDEEREPVRLLEQARAQLFRVCGARELGDLLGPQTHEVQNRRRGPALGLAGKPPQAVVRPARPRSAT